MIYRELLNKSFLFILMFLLTGLTYSCQDAPEQPSFAAAVGTRYIEVRRQFDDGHVFNRYGFQQEPEWIMEFITPDTVKIYSPFEKKFLHYPVYYEKDSIFNIAREWVQLRHLSKDSLILQLLQVEELHVKKDRSNVSMRFYSVDYIKKHHLDTAEMKKPRPTDTAFVQKLVSKAKKYSNNPDSILAARQPVKLISKAYAITVKQSHGVANMMDPSRAEEYLNPEYHIDIKGAYKDFNYNFSVIIDEQGRMKLGRFAVDEEFRASRTRVLQGIIDVYLQKYLMVIPGKTLGIPHPSEIMIYLKGRK